MARDYLTLDQALDHSVLMAVEHAAHSAWRQRQDARLHPLKSRPDVATNPGVYSDAVAAEIAADDPKPSRGALLLSKLREGRAAPSADRRQ